MLYVFISFEFLSKWTNFHEICYEYYATGGHHNLVTFYFLQSVITT